MLGFVVSSDFLMPGDLLHKITVEHSTPIIPVNLVFRLGDQVYLDRSIFQETLANSITSTEFYSYMKDHSDMKDFPGTSAPNVAMFQQAYEEAFARGTDHLFVLPLLPKHSATFNNAFLAARDMSSQIVDTSDFDDRGNYHGDRPYIHFGMGLKTIDVVNTRTASAGIGHLVRQIWQNHGNADIISDAASDIYVGVAISDARYIAQRIQKLPMQVRAALGSGANILGMKALFEINEGEVEPSGGVSRTRSGIQKKIIERLAARPYDQEIYVLHTGDEQVAVQFKDRLIEELPQDNSIHVAILTPTIGSYVGWGSYGVVAYRRKTNGTI